MKKTRMLSIVPLAFMLLAFPLVSPCPALTIDLNSADNALLNKLEDAGYAGLGQAIAQRRNELGSFKNLEDVRSVPGMTEEIFQQLYPYELNESIVIEVEMPPGMASY